MELTPKLRLKAPKWCGWVGHAWGKWIQGMRTAYSNKWEGKVAVQERTCARCGMQEVRKL